MKDLRDKQPTKRYACFEQRSVIEQNGHFLLCRGSGRHIAKRVNSDSCTRKLDFTVIHYITKGYGIYKRPGHNDIHVKAGDIITAPTGVEFVLNSSEDDPIDERWLGFLGSYVDSWIGNMIHDKVHVFNIGNDSLTIKIMDDIFNTMKYRMPNYRERSAMLIHNLVVHLWEMQNKVFDTINNDLIKELVYDIHKHLDEPVFDFEEWADMNNLSYHTLRRIFSQNMKKSPNAYFIDMKITEAKRLLLYYPEMLIKEIAVKVGYEDQYYFSRLFKSKEKISPQDFRKQNTGNYYPVLM